MSLTASNPAQDDKAREGGTHARILVVSLPRELFERIDPFLNRSYFSVDRVQRAESAVPLCGHVTFDLIIAGYPLPDMDVRDFLGVIRRTRSPCAGSYLILVAGEPHLAEMTGRIRDSRCAVLPSSRPRAILVTCRMPAGWRP